LKEIGVDKHDDAGYRKTNFIWKLFTALFSEDLSPLAVLVFTAITL